MIKSKIPMGRREIKKAQAKQSLIESAIKNFTKEGISKTSIEDITKDAGLAVGTFYNYFESKEALLLSFATEMIENIKNVSKDKIQKDVSATKILCEVEKTTWDEISKKPFMGNLLLHGHKPKKIIPFWDILIEKMRTVFANVIKYGQKRKEFRKDVSSTIAAEMMYSVLQSAFYGKSKMSIRDNAKMKFKIFLAGIEVTKSK